MPTDEMVGRRIPVTEAQRDPFTLLTQAGDYCGPMVTRPGGLPEVWFLLPIARDAGVTGGARALHHCESPPHVFREEPDGSLTIRESIGAGPRENYYWHGYLTKGRWELVKSCP